MALSRMIRFGLLDLSARNGHHGFEELCRALAVSRIASNVYPATGPVSAGGDQGRDFQTFASHIAKELGAHGGFAALVSDGPIAFLCTLQAERIPAKVRSDLTKIAAGEPPVETVYAMLAADLPSAVSTKLKREAREQHGISRSKPGTARERASSSLTSPTVKSPSLLDRPIDPRRKARAALR